VGGPTGAREGALAKLERSALDLLGLQPDLSTTGNADTVTANEAAPPESVDRTDSLIEAAAEALALTIDPAWKPAIRANLLVNLRLAAMVAELPLPDDAEPAPVFEA
jgi:hypothetical protein